MSMSAHLQVEEVADGLLVRVDRQDLDEEVRQDATRQLFALAETQGARRWFLDLNGMESLGGGALADLLRLDRELRRLGGRLSLRNLHPRAYEVFHICRLTDLLASTAVP